MSAELSSPFAARDLFTIVVQAEGEIDLGTVETLREQLNAAIDVGASCIVVDMTHVTFMDSSGLTQLIATHQGLTPTGQLVLRHVAANVRRVLEVSGLDTVLIVED